ncbi:hypothetical protein HIM_10272 [Hirsutella minnesotensis 3608]|uniref:HTH CENPB-type domain-containing protein n=1 Tax=Hirsutella minnesotensis 3608 TaxID=1043627 RepID=A0A0F7ZRW9_9HYPO|nr:hypothetical protein HIM_10272 [Hirsutella minnesotensis 3608]
MSSLSQQLTAIERWIDSATGKPVFSRNTAENVESRTVAAAELFHENFYPTIKAASDAFGVPYLRLRSRIRGHHPVARNGGNRTLLGPEEEQEILCWAHRRITQGHHIQRRALQHHANAILKAKGVKATASRTWAWRFLKRWDGFFHCRKSATRDAKRKAMEDRARIEAFFNGWFTFLRDHDIPLEAISANGRSIPSFLILPGVNIPVRWVDNDLDDNTIITTSPKGYINDIIAIEWIKHFEQHTRPASGKRVLLMDGCDNHFTDEIFHFCSNHGIELFPLPPHLTHCLQPLDVGVFGPYKHWHQQVLYREIADGATDFNKTDFLYHLQEIRNRTFKKATILSAWEKCGLFPFDPNVVLDKLQDALSSLTQEIDESELPGFINPTVEPNKAEEEYYNDTDDYLAGAGRRTEGVISPSQLTPTLRTPRQRRQFDWNDATTPRLSIVEIRQYERYVKLRMEASMISYLPMTPTVSRVHEKACKAANTLAINGITAIAEMRRLEEKQLKRAARQERTQIVGKYGPLSVGDARLRVARDEYRRRAAQEEEDRRMKKKAAREEATFVKRWNRDCRGMVRYSITKTKPRQHAEQGGWLKSDRRAYLDSAKLMCSCYRFIRELRYLRDDHDALEQWCDEPQRRRGAYRRWLHTEPLKRPRPGGNAFTWPDYYDDNVIQAASALVVQESQDRADQRQALSFEADGLEITAIEVVSSGGGEFEVIKEEGDIGDVIQCSLPLPQRRNGDSIMISDN